jgi:hypothetical protein
MDGSQFDALLRRATQDSSRRGVLRSAVGVLAAATLGLVGLSASEDVEAGPNSWRTLYRHRIDAGSHDGGHLRSSGKKNCPPCKKRKHGKCKKKEPDGTACEGGTCRGGSCVQAVPPPGDPCSQSGGFHCGALCCPEKSFPVCCAPDANPDYASCWPPGYQCCMPLGGGACAPDEVCCPRRFGLRALCSNPARGERCCEAVESGGSGGFCAADEGCCPHGVTNQDNSGCCPSGAACCNDTTDCNEAAGETCLRGCCG